MNSSTKQYINELAQQVINVYDITIPINRRFGTSEQEYQANEFAASLLMPKDRYKKIVSEYAVNGTVDMARVANYFNVIFCQ